LEPLTELNLVQATTDRTLQGGGMVIVPRHVFFGRTGKEFAVAPVGR
jgi:hypothetical protein